jgi:hypothetical protein
LFFDLLAVLQRQIFLLQPLAKVIDPHLQRLWTVNLGHSMNIKGGKRWALSTLPLINGLLSAGKQHSS